MHQLVSKAVSHGRDAVDPAALADLARTCRSAALTGANHTTARTGS
jgi:hypothetical protein